MPGGHSLKDYSSELDADATIVSFDGRSTYETVSRTAFLTKLREVAPALVPCVRAWYGGTSTYFWWDAEGRRHESSQGDGCEQGDALAPALKLPGATRRPGCGTRAIRAGGVPRRFFGGSVSRNHSSSCPACAR